MTKAPFSLWLEITSLYILHIPDLPTPLPCIFMISTKCCQAVLNISVFKKESGICTGWQSYGHSGVLHVCWTLLPCSGIWPHNHYPTSGDVTWVSYFPCVCPKFHKTFLRKRGHSIFSLIKRTRLTLAFSLTCIPHCLLDSASASALLASSLPP